MKSKPKVHFQCKYSNVGVPLPFAVLVVVLMTPLLNMTMDIDLMISFLLVSGSIVLSYIAPGVGQLKTVTITCESIDVVTHGPTMGGAVRSWPISDIRTDSLALGSASILGFHAIRFRVKCGDKADISFPSRKLAIKAIRVIKRLKTEITGVQQS